MFKIMMMPDTENFLKVVEHSQGEVLLHLPDHSQCDLKTDNTAKQLIRTMKLGNDGLCVSLSDPEDIPAFIEYMIGSARNHCSL